MGTGFSGSDWPKGAFFSSASWGRVLGLRGTERKRPLVLFFRLSLLIAIYCIRVSSQAHSVLQCWGKTLGHGKARQEGGRDQQL